MEHLPGSRATLLPQDLSLSPQAASVAGVDWAVWSLCGFPLCLGTGAQAGLVSPLKVTEERGDRTTP